MATTRPRKIRERPISIVVYSRHLSAAFASAGCGGSGPASAEGRRVQPPILIHAGDQRDRPRRRQADKQFVGLAGRTTFQIKINRLELSLRFGGSRFNRQGKFSQFCWDFYLSPRKFTLVNLSFFVFRITC